MGRQAALVGVGQFDPRNPDPIRIRAVTSVCCKGISADHRICSPAVKPAFVAVSFAAALFAFDVHRTTGQARPCGHGMAEVRILLSPC